MVNFTLKVSFFDWRPTAMGRDQSVTSDIRTTINSHTAIEFEKTALG